MKPGTRDEGRVTSAENREMSPARTPLPIHFLHWVSLVVTVLLFSLPSSLVPVARAEDSAAQHYQSGLTYERLGRYDEAYTELQLASALNPSDSQAALALGIVASRLGRLEVALRALEQSIATNSGSVASYYHLALVYEKNGSKDRAVDAWHRFISLSQDEALKVVAKKHLQYLEHP